LVKSIFDYLDGNAANAIMNIKKGYGFCFWQILPNAYIHLKFTGSLINVEDDELL
jgi:hypothetical protein